MTPADQDMGKVSAAQGEVRALIDTSRDLTEVRRQLSCSGGVRLACAGQLHNLVGDLEELKREWLDDKFGDFTYAAKQTEVFERLYAVEARLKDIA